MTKNGFSLIEILIAIAISLLAAGAAIAGYRNFNTAKIADVAAEEVYSQLVLIKSKAVSGEKASPSCVNLNYYMIDVVDGELSYTEFCLDVNGTPDQQGTTILDDNGYKDRLFCNSSGTSSNCSFGFRSLSGKTTDDVDHELFIRYNGCERKILIEGNGSISIKACP